MPLRQRNDDMAPTPTTPTTTATGSGTTESMTAPRIAREWSSSRRDHDETTRHGQAPVGHRFGSGRCGWCGPDRDRRNGAGAHRGERDLVRARRARARHGSHASAGCHRDRCRSVARAGRIGRGADAGCTDSHRGRCRSRRGRDRAGPRRELSSPSRQEWAIALAVAMFVLAFILIVTRERRRRDRRVSAGPSARPDEQLPRDAGTASQLSSCVARFHREGKENDMAIQNWDYPEDRYYYRWYEEAPTPPSDSDIKAQVVDRLRENPFTSDSTIKVDVKQAVVVLGGDVPSTLAKRAAGDDAWDVPGVVDVSNQLRIAPQQLSRHEGSQPSATRCRARSTRRATWCATPAGRGSGLRLRLDLRPLPPVGERPGPQPVRVVGARRRSRQRPSASRSGVGVTCPIVRIHPAIVAQAAATTSLLLEGRFFFGVGTGEALNEHILGHRWPPTRGPPGDARGGGRRSSAAAVDRRDRRPPRRLLRGRERQALRPAGRAAADHRLGVRPEGDRSWPPGSATATGATRPTRELVDAFEEAGGTGPGTRSSTCAGQRTRPTPARPCTRSGPTAASPASCPRTCPTWTHFEQAAELVTEDDATKSVPCGPDVEPDARLRPRVPRRRLRPPLLPPDRARPGRLLPVLDRRAQARR